jgi:hypothetical protein
MKKIIRYCMNIAEGEYKWKYEDSFPYTASEKRLIIHNIFSEMCSEGRRYLHTQKNRPRAKDRNKLPVAKRRDLFHRQILYSKAFHEGLECLGSGAVDSDNRGFDRNGKLHYFWENSFWAGWPRN